MEALKKRGTLTGLVLRVSKGNPVAIVGLGVLVTIILGVFFYAILSAGIQKLEILETLFFSQTRE
jgi:hypothetical protein